MAAAHTVASRGLIVHSAPKSCPRGVFPSHFFTPGWFFKDLGAMFFVCSIMDSLSLSTCDTCRLRVQVARSSRTVDRDRTGLTESSVPLRCPPRPPKTSPRLLPLGASFQPTTHFPHDLKNQDRHRQCIVGLQGPLPPEFPGCPLCANLKWLALEEPGWVLAPCSLCQVSRCLFRPAPPGV